MTCDPFWNKTVLACHFDGANGSTTFTDEKGHTLTANGNAQISTTQSKFGGSSAYFDGSGDYLLLSSSYASDFNFGTGDFTVEAFIKLAAMPTSDSWPSSRDSHMCIFTHGQPSAAPGFGLLLGATKIMCNNNDQQVASGTHGMTTGVWYHVAACRSGTILRTFVDGVIVGTSMGISTDYTYAQASWVGCETGEGAWFNGYIDDLRITKAARYTANFTPDTSAFLTNQCAISGTVKDYSGDFARRIVRAYRRSDGAFASQAVSDAVTGVFSCTALDTSAHYVLQLDGSVPEFDPYWNNVVLAMHMDDTGLTDLKGHVVTLAGGLTRSATQSKFGGYSASFDGTDDYFYLSGGADFTFGTGDFTIEMFVYVDAAAAYRQIFDFRPAGTNGWYPTMVVTDAGVVRYEASAATRILGTTDIRGGWHHIELSRSSGVTKLFIDGVQEGGDYIDTNNYGCGASRPAFGTGAYTIPTSLFKGYMEDLLIIKGMARHTANFLPPLAAFLHGATVGSPSSNALIFDNVIPV